MLPIDLAAVWLFHAIRIRFGISRSGARFGALTLGLSPLFIPLGASFMTDISGLFAVLFCLYLCLRALEAETENAALMWLCAAVLANVVSGTARQIAWLGALMIIPPTGWLMRRTPRLLATAAVLWFASLGSIVVLLLWWSRQPYSVPEKLIHGAVHWPMLIKLGEESIRGALCLAFLLLSLLCLWIPRVRTVYERRNGREIPRLAYIPLIAIGCYSSISTHDLFALDRARIAAVREVVNSGVPENAVQAEFEYDGLTQIKVAGYVNFPEIRVPASAYKPDDRYFTRPPECRFAFDKYFSALDRQYVVAFPGSQCGRRSSFRPVNYRTWLPPFHRTLEIDQIR